MTKVTTAKHIRNFFLLENVSILFATFLEKNGSSNDFVDSQLRLVLRILLTYIIQRIISPAKKEDHTFPAFLPKESTCSFSIRTTASSRKNQAMRSMSYIRISMPFSNKYQENP